MRSAFIIAALLGAAGPVAGCKIVPDPDPAALAAANQTDEQRMATWVKDAWAPRLLPTVAKGQTDWTSLKTALDQGLPQAGAAFGLRPEPLGGQWYFAVHGDGTVTQATLDSRARRIDLDMDGDGTADLSLQPGPMIRGTAIRDAMPFITFTDFRDQIEFAKLGRALNDRAAADMPELPADLIGQRVTVTAVFGLRSADEPPLAVPLLLQVAP
ncbi:hypothetical protein BFP70_09215 [Thioclava sp. SK-1]|uniref:DUF2291 family protein n=1 Tax=Thioclava sp. SK-1 TaxID=1889770 RepID=UPI000824F941|nr:DUF2291 family protein [Thioclava sp. SK-1]OCX65654.1 hypothetical protein BFP70_09215 [Thioclava sp. SK-1]